MRFVVFAAAAALALLVTASGVAAQSNPIVEHYRAYVAALERGDLVEATSQAEEALAASEARDGDGGRTGVLVLNLAAVRLMAGDAENALSDAERALRLAQSGAEGVDPLFADLIAARAALSLEADRPGGAEAAARLQTALLNEGAASLPAAEVYAAAAQLGSWGFSHAQLELAESGWGIAGGRPEGSPFGERFGFGRARTNEALAIVTRELRRRGSSPIDEDAANRAHMLLSDAVRVLHPLAQIESPTLELTVAQQTYSEARAWLMALASKMDADGHRVPETPWEAQGDADGFSEIGPIDLTRPRCPVRVIARPLPDYPRQSQVAAVMLFFRVNAEGEIVAHEVAARAGAPEFAQAIERVIRHWRIERLEDSPPNCRMEASLLQGVRFVLAN